MNYIEPSDEEIRTIFIQAPYYNWPTFEHMPLNCFDIGIGLLMFPGDISNDRSLDPDYFAAYKFDINDESTCPRFSQNSAIEYWNEASLLMRWFLGRLNWACTVDMGEYALKNGYFSVGVGVVRYQNMPEITDLRECSQLKNALVLSLAQRVADGLCQPFNDKSFIEKEINGSQWLIARTLNGLGYPEYRAVLPIDERTVVHVPATLDNCWERDETIPDGVEQKHLASFWDFLSQVQLRLERTEEWQVGTQIREAPGQASQEEAFKW